MEDDDRIGLLFCIDAIPAFRKKKGELSLMPAEFMILSLPPQVRIKAKYMMLSMLVPASLKAESQKKYFDFLAIAELNYMTTVGLNSPGGRTKVRVFGATLDLPGRDKFMWLRGRYSLCC